MFANFLMIIAIAATFVVVMAYLLFRKENKSEEERIKKFSYDALRSDVRKYINGMISANMVGMGLSKKTLKNQEQQRIAVSGYVRNCCDDEGAREALKELIRNYLSRERGVNESTINYAIPFHNSKAMSARQMMETMLYHLGEGKDLGFEKLYVNYGWEEYAKSDECEIDEETVRRTWAMLSPSLSFIECLNVLVQMIYADEFGKGVIDILAQQKESVEEVQFGLCGLPAKTYCYKDEVLGAEENGRRAEYSKDSIYTLVRGNILRLKFLSFETDDELQRVQNNLIKNSGAGELTVNNPLISIETPSGERISVSRPPATDAKTGFIRKFDAIRDTDMVRWCSSMKDGDLAAELVKQLTRAGMHITVTGEMTSGKTTVVRAMFKEIKKGLTIRTVESESLELNLRRFLKGRNVLALRVTDSTPEEDILAFIRKTSGQVFCVGEITSAPMANLYTNLVKISQQLLASAHYVETEDMISDMVNAKLSIGGYTNERLAEMDVVRALQFDVHVAKRNGVRYIQRINEIVPDFDMESRFSDEEISDENALLSVASGVRELRQQAGKMRTYKIRPILEYSLEEEKMILHNKPSEGSYKKAKEYMTSEQFEQFVEIFDLLELEKGV